MPVLRTYADVLAFCDGPTDAEQKLIEACKAGELCVLGAGRPDQGDDDRTIRSDVLRYLILGGCESCPVATAGVHLVGAYVSGQINLDFATTHGATRFVNCVFEQKVMSDQTQFEAVSFNGCALPGWFAQGADVKGNVLLRNTIANATINLNGAAIGGQLVCGGARFSASSQPYAFVASGAKIAGGVFLHPRSQENKDKVETPLQCTGEMRLNGATIGGLYAQNTTFIATETGQTLSLGGTTVTGAVRLDGCKSTGEILLAGARISGRLTCERMTLENDAGHAFNGQAMRVEHSFVWKKVEHVSGAVSLNGAHVAELDDHPDNWPNSDALFLDGFTYDRIKGTVSTSPARMDWLKSGSYFGEEFRPQPYSQYAKFLRDTGHDEDARRVLYVRERKRRASTRKQLRAAGHSFAGPLNLWFGFWDILLRFVVGYGHFPFRSVAALAVLIVCTIVPAHFAWEEGSFAPNAPPVLVSDAWIALARTEDKPAAVWSGDQLPKETVLALPEWKAQAPGRDWETFNSYAYGFDVIIPIIDFGQTEAWAPSTNRGVWGWHLWWGRWLMTGAGWIVTALGAAAITGIIRRE